MLYHVWNKNTGCYEEGVTEESYMRLLNGYATAVRTAKNDDSDRSNAEILEHYGYEIHAMNDHE